MIRNLPLMPEQASKFAEDMDPLFFVLVLLTIIFFGIVMAMVLFFAIRYRRDNRVDRTRAVNEHHILETTWTLIPLLLGLGVFVWGAKLFAGVFGPPPANAMEVYVIGKQWMWHLQHTNGIRENNELHIPLGRPVKLTMISQDVVHDFFVPEFRIHMDVVPGRYTKTWFEPTKVGRYHLFCSQYCGTNHSQMTGWVYVMKPADYAQWLANGGSTPVAGPQTMATAGAALYEQHACGQCHDPDGMGRGPSLIGIYNSQVKLDNGSTVRADDAYLRDAILNPSEKVAAPYQQVMPSYKGQLTEEQLLDVIAYIKSLTSPNPPSAEPIPAPAGPGSASRTKPNATQSTHPSGSAPPPASATQAASGTSGM